MKISIITLFPEMLQNFFDFSISKRAQKEGKISLEFVNLRDFGLGQHKIVDDKPYGGGAGMLLRVDVVDKAIQSVKKDKKNGKVVLLDPKGRVYKQELAEEFARLEDLILICGHYEGFDERIRSLVDYEISIGDYVLSGGELAAAVVTESVLRLIPGVLKKDDAAAIESFSQKKGKRLLEYPHYTRPENYNGIKVPEILLSGNHKEIEKYREKQGRKITQEKRPDLT